MRAVCCGGEDAVQLPRAAPRPARQSLREGKGRPADGDRQARAGFVVHCSWSCLAFAVQLLLRCCRASRLRVLTSSAVVCIYMMIIAQALGACAQQTRPR